MSDLISAFRTITGDSGVLTGNDVSERMIHVWYQQPIVAKCIVRPRSTAELAAIVKLCHEANQSIIPHGGLTGLVQGCNATENDVVISVERLNEIEEIDPVGRTMTVAAGVPLQVVQEKAAEHGLMFPLDLGARGSCVIGGNVSTNAGGNNVVRFGMTRDNVLGLEAVLADGTVVTSLNTMIKNNAGYDLKQLFIGTEGTLGIVSRVVLRLREAPHSFHTAFAGFEDFSQLSRFLRFADRELGGALSTFEVMWRDYYELVTTAPADNVRPVPLDYEHYVLIESLGNAHDSDGNIFTEIMGAALEQGLIADAAVAQSENDRKAMWRIRDSVDEFFRYGPAFLYDVSLGIRYMDQYVQEVKRALRTQWPDHHCFTLGHIADGNVHFAIAVGDDSEDSHAMVNACVYEPLDGIGGSVSAEHGIGHEKLAYLSLSRSETEIEVMRRLKRALDPKGILNPGKVFAV